MPSIMQQPPARPELVAPACLMPAPSTAPPTMAVAARDLGKRNGHVQALRSLTCQAPAVQICGFLGHNGTGKTPTLTFRITAPRADSGSARVLGWEARRHAERTAQHIGVVDEERNLYERISARDKLALMAGPYAVADAPRRSGEVLALVGLGNRARDPADKYSNLSGVSLLAGFPILLVLLPFLNANRALLG